MNNQYLSLIKQVQSKVSPAPSWKSDQKSLKGIFEYADRNNIDPAEVIGTDICKLRTIIKAAKAAIANDDPERLQELFHLAATSTIVNLRLGLGITKPDVIHFYRNRWIDVETGDEREDDYFLASPECFKRLQQSARLICKFVEKDYLPYMPGACQWETSTCMSSLNDTVAEE